MLKGEIMNFDSLRCDGFSVTKINGLTVITDDRFSCRGVVHGFTTRHGGVSKGEFASLNLAYSQDRDDPRENIISNFAILTKAFATSDECAVRTHQTHSDNIVADAPGGTGFTLPQFDTGVDGLISHTDGQLVVARMADCLPILLYDTESHAVGAIHSGWKGTVQRIGAKAVRMMCDIYNSKESSILVSFGPSVGPCCYEVGEDFRQTFIDEFGSDISSAFTSRNGSLYADMRKINLRAMTDCGIPAENIAVYKPCTCCTPEHFYSYRRQKNCRGTMVAVIKCNLGDSHD